jgi:hypothetical protein
MACYCGPGSDCPVHGTGSAFAWDMGLFSESQHALLCMANWDCPNLHALHMSKLGFLRSLLKVSLQSPGAFSIHVFLVVFMLFQEQPLWEHKNELFWVAWRKKNGTCMDCRRPAHKPRPAAVRYWCCDSHHTPGGGPIRRPPQPEHVQDGPHPIAWHPGKHELSCLSWLRSKVRGLWRRRGRVACSCSGCAAIGMPAP